MSEIAAVHNLVGCGNQVILGVAVARWSCEDPESESDFGDVAVEASKGWGFDKHRHRASVARVCDNCQPKSCERRYKGTLGACEDA
jgi:hypothetical protein